MFKTLIFDFTASPDLGLIWISQSLGIANDVSNKSFGFDSDYNEVTIYYKNKNKEIITRTKKSIIANNIVNKVLSVLN